MSKLCKSDVSLMVSFSVLAIVYVLTWTCLPA
jgi:hypothetical protein